MSEEKTLGQIWHEGACATAPGVVHAKWADMNASEVEWIEAGAQAVADQVTRQLDVIKAAIDDEPKPEQRYALVEQMGHRSTVATVSETVFCGQPMLEITDLKTGSTHTISPQSIYEISWLTEDAARARAKPWTATAIAAGQQLAYDEDAEAEAVLGGDPIDEDLDSYPDAAQERDYDTEGNEL